MTDSLIINGVPWYDDRGIPVNAHGAGVLRDEGRYYLFGEYKTDEENRFNGFSCYSSTDLARWSFEGIALPPQPAGLLGPNRIGERPKVLRCPATGQFVMLMHTDDVGYTDPVIGVATSDTVAGPYQFRGTLAFEGSPIRRWDIGAFQDADGTGYLLVHEGDIYRLDDTYTGAAEKVATNIAPGGESPAMFALDGLYYLLCSNKTSWERNDNYYLTAPSPRGHWIHRGLIAPPGTQTHNSQCSFVLPLDRDGRQVPLYLGDRWSFPRQASAATYVWLPIEVDGAHLTLGEYWQTWDPATLSPAELQGRVIEFAFTSDVPAMYGEMRLAGRQFALLGDTGPAGGYGRIEIRTEAGRPVTTADVDFYSQTPSHGLRYVSPILPDQHHILRVTVTGANSTFHKKNGERLGSAGLRVSVSGVQILE